MSDSVESRPSDQLVADVQPPISLNHSRSAGKRLRFDSFFKPENLKKFEFWFFKVLFVVQFKTGRIEFFVAS